MLDVETKCVQAFYNSINKASTPNLNLSVAYNLDTPYSEVYRRYKYPSLITLSNTIKDLYERVDNTSVVFTNCGISTYNFIYMCYPKHRFILSKDLDKECKELIESLTIFTKTIDINKLEEEQLTDNDIIIVDSLTNEILISHDIKHICEIAHKYKSKVVVDNSVLSCINYNPFKDNADIVIESGTKWLSGFGDALLGIVIGADVPERLHRYHGLLPNPLDVYLVQKGITTLPMRMNLHRENSKQVLEYIKTICKDYRYDNRVGIIVFTLNQSNSHATFCCNTKLITHAAVFGQVNSTMFSRRLEYIDEPFKRHIRLSVGLESPKDIINDLKLAYNSIRNND